MKKLLIVLSLMLTMTGCNLYNMEEILHAQQDISLTWRGKTQIEYKSESFQLGYRVCEDSYEYRVYDDKLAHWFILKCNQRPDTEGQTLNADVSWTAESKTHSIENLTFTVEKTDDSGLVWLWNETNRIGAVISTDRRE